jgi:hypothetical protein
MLHLAPLFWGRLFTVLIVTAGSCSPIYAKTVSGDFRLSGLQSHRVLVSFAVVPDGARVSVNLTASFMYENERFLQLRMYRDVEWSKVIKAKTCTEMIRHASQTQQLSFDYKNKQWKSEEKTALIFNSDKGTSRRPHYWYIVVDDCSLEQVMQDLKIPPIHYELRIQNHIPQKNTDGGRPEMVLTHLSADELPLTRVHSVSLVLSSLIALLICMLIGSQLVSKHTVHVALLWVAAAAALDAASSLCELIHIKVYQGNGVGSYLFDALSAHAEAVCDALVMLLLLSIAAGWTLPSDMLSMNPNQSVVQLLLSDLSKPMGAIQHWNAGTALGLAVLALHVVLAQWGRTYNDDFESYHDLEHLPGKILMAVRFVLGLLCLAATMQTRWKCRAKQLEQFYLNLAIAGFAWFQSLPVLVVICNTFVPYYVRHPAIVTGSALLQSVALGLLAWLVTSHSSAYHQVSHLTSSAETSLTDSLSQAAGGQARGVADTKTWSFGKSKIRLD